MLIVKEEATNNLQETKVFITEMQNNITTKYTKMSKNALSRKRSLYFIKHKMYMKYEEMLFPLSNEHKIPLWGLHKIKKVIKEWFESR